MAVPIKRQHKLILMIVMIVYLVILCYLLFFSDKMGRTAEVADYRYNLVLFKEIRRFITQWRYVGLQAVMVNIVGNIAAFMPFGGLAACLIHPRERWYLITLLSFELSLGVELLQLVTKLGCFDVDDLFLNTVGGLAGYLVYWLYGRFRRAVQRRTGK